MTLCRIKVSPESTLLTLASMRAIFEIQVELVGGRAIDFELERKQGGCSPCVNLFSTSNIETPVIRLSGRAAN